MQPTIGRIVHYKSRGSADGKFPSVARAAIVTDVKTSSDGADGPEGTLVKWSVRLCVLSPEGIFLSDWLEEGEEAGNWNWPPRV